MRRPALDPSGARFKIHLLGRFEVLRGDAPIPPQSWRRRRPADLLKLVALAEGRTLSREQVIEQLWPGKSLASGANNLHRALYDLRQVVGGRLLDLEKRRLRLPGDVWVDVDAFEAAAAAGDPASLQAAVALYRGDLSPEDRESPWLAGPRAQLRRLFTRAAFPLAREAAASGDAVAAVPLLRRILEIEPASEEAHRILMRILAEAGRRADALRQYDACEAALGLARAPGPGAEIRVLREAILQSTIGPAQAHLPYDGHRRVARRLLGTSKPPPLRGRTAALVLLASIVEQGSGMLVLLGERGVGKTRLAVEGARIAQERGALVLAGLVGGAVRGPCAPFIDAVADHRRCSGTSAPDPFAAGQAPTAGADAEQHRRRLHEAVARWLTAVGAGRPVYLLLDDIHGADEASLNLLHYLARSARSLGLMLVATCREDEVRAGTPIQMALSHLDCERLARGIRVQRLDLQATREQIGDIMGSAPGEALASQIYRLTDGSPFYTEESTRGFQESGQLAPARDPGAAVRARVARLGPAVEALLEAGAVVGQRFDFEVARPAAGLGLPEALSALERCTESRLLEEDGSGYHFHHSLVREALYGRLDPARRAELHRKVADLVEAQAAAAPDGLDGAAEALAHHRRMGGQPDRAFRHLLAAGHRAAAAADLRDALDFFSQAMGMAREKDFSPGRSEIFQLLEATGRVQLGLGDLSGLARTFGPGEAGLDVTFTPAEQARAAQWLALGLAAGGRGVEAEERLAACLAAPHVPEKERAEILRLLAVLRWHAGDAPAALEAAERCAEGAARAGDADLAASGKRLAALAQASLGGRPLGPAEPARASRDEVFDLDLALFERELVGERPRRQIESSVGIYGEWARRHQDPRGAALARSMEGALALASARWDVAEAALRDALALQRTHGSALAEAFTLERLGMLLTARGRLEEGMSMLAEGVIAAERGSLRRHGLTRLHASLARNRLAAGAVYAAEDCIRDASETAARHGDCLVCDAHFRPEVVRVALARGRLGQAESEAAQLESIAARCGGTVLASIARAARARVLAAQGRWEQAHPAVEEARQGFLAAGDVFEAARCLILESQALRAAGPGSVLLAEKAASEAAEVLGPLGPPTADT